MTPLRQRFLDELARRNYSPRTVEAYLSRRWESASGGETGRAQTEVWGSGKTAPTRWPSDRDTDRMAMRRAVPDGNPPGRGAPPDGQVQPNLC